MNLPPVQAIAEDDLAFLRGVDSPTIANAIESFKLRDRTEGFLGGRVRSQFPDLPPMVGTALTVTMNDQAGPVKGREGFWQMFEALATVPAPSVIVVQDTSEHPERVAFCGEVMATMAQRLGAVGYVTDGTVRDLHEVQALGLAYFASGVCVSHANFWIEEVGIPVILDGQEVRTGDLLHGDANGIVIVPREVLAGLSQAVQNVRDQESELMTFARSAEFSLDGAKKLTGYR